MIFIRQNFHSENLKIYPQLISKLSKRGNSYDKNIEIKFLSKDNKKLLEVKKNRAKIFKIRQDCSVNTVNAQYINLELHIYGNEQIV